MKYLASGDGEGSIYFWDFHTSKLLKQMSNIHKNGPCSALAWHPLDPTMIASAGWDGIIQIHQ